MNDLNLNTNITPTNITGIAPVDSATSSTGADLFENILAESTSSYSAMQSAFLSIKLIHSVNTKGLSLPGSEQSIAEIDTLIEKLLELLDIKSDDIEKLEENEDANNSLGSLNPLGQNYAQISYKFMAVLINTHTVSDTNKNELESTLADLHNKLGLFDQQLNTKQPFPGFPQQLDYNPSNFDLGDQQQLAIERYKSYYIEVMLNSINIIGGGDNSSDSGTGFGLDGLNSTGSTAQAEGNILSSFLS